MAEVLLMLDGSQNSELQQILSMNAVGRCGEKAREGLGQDLINLTEPLKLIAESNAGPTAHTPH